MPELVDTVLEDESWGKVDLAGLAEIACTATLGRFELDARAFEISLLGCNDARISDLNADFRDKPQATNVLSWPSSERGAGTPGAMPNLPASTDRLMPHELGDIAIAFETCEREANVANKPLPAHATHLLVHATLHLLGFDHISDQDAVLMQGLETEILATLGQDDPYRTD